MEIRQLRYFLKAAQRMSFTKAAGELFITQPSMSQQIVALESELGVRLFLREKGKVRLTPAGEALVPEAEAVVRGAEDIFKTMAAFASGEAGALEIGVLEFFEYSFLPEVAKSLKSAFPGLKISLGSNSVSGLREEIRLGRNDVNVTLLPRNFYHAGLEKLVVNSDSLALVLPPRSPFGSLRWFDREALRPVLSRPFFLWREWFEDESGAVMEFLRGLCPDMDVRREDRFMVCLMNVVVENGFSVLPRNMVSQLGTAEFVTIPLDIPEAMLDMAVVYDPENRNPALRLFLDEVGRVTL